MTTHLQVLRGRAAELVKRMASRLTTATAGAHVEALLTSTDEGFFLVHSTDFSVGRALRVRGAYAVEELATIRSYCRQQDRVLVVGAHVGSIAIPVARDVHHVTAIEASPSTYRLLQQNIALNESENLEAVELAASDTAGELQFLQGRINTGGNKRMPINMERRYTFDRPSTVTVRADRLDRAFESETFDLIVMDIEGSEPFALKGMPRLLSAARMLFVEFVPHHLRDVAGIGVDDFFELLSPHFDVLHSPRLGRTATSAERVSAMLHELFDADISDDGLIFWRSAAELKGVTT